MENLQEKNTFTKLSSLLYEGKANETIYLLKRLQKSLVKLVSLADEDSLNIIARHINLSNMCTNYIEEYKGILDSAFVDELYSQYNNLHLNSRSDLERVQVRKLLDDVLYLGMFAFYGVRTMKQEDYKVGRILSLVDNFSKISGISLPSYELESYFYKKYDDPTFDFYLHLFRFVYNNKPTSDLAILQHHLILNYLRGQWDVMLKYTNSSSSFVIGRANKVDIVMYDMLKHLDRMRKTLPVKIQEIVSKPGLGKTTYVHNFATFISALIPFRTPNELVYKRVSDFFWNGYTGQPIVLYDDISHNKNRKIDIVGELIAIGSGALDSPPMAFEKNTKFVSLFCFITSNIPIITTIANPETVLALKRRLFSDQVLPYCNVARLDEEGIYKYRIKGKFLSSIISKTSFTDFMHYYINNVKESEMLDLEFDEDFDSPGIQSLVGLESLDHASASSVGGFCPTLVGQGVESDDSINCFGPSINIEAHLNNRHEVNSDNNNHEPLLNEDSEVMKCCALHPRYPSFGDTPKNTNFPRHISNQ